MDVWDAEGAASHLLELAGASGPMPSPARVARALLGPDGLRRVPRAALGEHAKLAPVNGRFFIFVRAGLAKEHERFAIAHECAEYLYRDEEAAPNIEEACNALAGAILMPRQAYLAVARDVGPDFPALAAAFATTATAAALRYGETTRHPIAVGSPVRVRVRGADFSWPAEERLLRDAAREGRPGLRKAVLPGRGRWALFPQFFDETA